MLKAFNPPELLLRLLKDSLKTFYGLQGDWTRLVGERDQNHRVRTSQGPYILKVCNPSEGEAIALSQAAALEHIAETDPELPVPRLIRARTGEALPSIDVDGTPHRLMLLTYLEGSAIAERELQPHRYFELGQLVARLGVALRGFVDGAPASRNLVWDTARAATLLDHTAALPLSDRELAEGILLHHRDVTVPILKRQRAQIIHGDIGPFNVVANTDGTITGLIDFGDLVHATLVQDIANAASDFLLPGRDHARTIFEMVRGYAAVTRLAEEEVEAILGMIEVRILMNALIDRLKLKNGIASSDDLAVFEGRTFVLLRELREARDAGLADLIRRAAAFPPRRPQGETFDHIVARRRRVMGRKLYVFYDPPLHIVRGEGVWLHDAEGRRYLDCYNNVPHVGHCHPYVTEAIVRQARTLNTNTRYITDQSIEYAERLGALSGEGLSAVVFVNSGSEANDLAFRMAKAWTGKSGGLAMEFAYHGVTESMDAFSPSNAPASWNAPHVRLLPAPCVYRGMLGPDEPDLGERYAALADPLIAELDDRGFGVAAAMIDSAFMTNGILDAPPGYLQGIVRRVHAAGGLFIADEVQSGFGRMGTAFWGHRYHGVVPDFITTGKPAGNGHPVGAVITRPEILEHFTSFGPFFSTFGGNNVACAAGIAVLDVIRDEGLTLNARDVGAYFLKGLRSLISRHSLIGDVRGAGLAIGLELVRDRKTKEPADSEAARLLNLVRDEGVLMGGEGKFGNVIKIRPPIVFKMEDADLAVDALDRALSRL